MSEEQLQEAWEAVGRRLQPYLRGVGYPTDVAIEMMIAMSTKAVQEEGSSEASTAFARSSNTVLDTANDMDQLLQSETDAHADTMHPRHMFVRESKKFLGVFERFKTRIEEAAKREQARLEAKREAERKMLWIQAPDKGEGEAALKVLFPLFRKEGTSTEQFFSYWKGTHAELVRSLLKDLGAYRYEQLERLPGAKRYGSRTPAAATCDGVGVVWWQDVETKQRANEREKAARAARLLHADETKFLDMSKSHSFLTEHRFSGSNFSLPPAGIMAAK